MEYGQAGTALCGAEVRGQGADTTHGWCTGITCMRIGGGGGRGGREGKEQAVVATLATDGKEHAEDVCTCLELQIFCRECSTSRGTAAIVRSDVAGVCVCDIIGVVVCVDAVVVVAVAAAVADGGGCGDGSECVRGRVTVSWYRDCRQHFSLLVYVCMYICGCVCYVCVCRGDPSGVCASFCVFLVIDVLDNEERSMQTTNL